MQGTRVGGQGWATRTGPHSGPAHSTPLLCVQARCPPRTMSMNTLSIPWRNTRTPRLLGMTLVRKGAGPRVAWGGAGRAVPADLSAPPCYPQTPARFHWTRVPAVPTPCAGIIGLGRGARRPVTPLSTVAVEGMPTVLGPGRPVSTAACPRRPTVKGQVRAYLHSSRGLPRLCPGSGSGVRSRARSPPRLGDLGQTPPQTKELIEKPGSGWSPQYGTPQCSLP